MGPTGGLFLPRSWGEAAGSYAGGGPWREVPISAGSSAVEQPKLAEGETISPFSVVNTPRQVQEEKDWDAARGKVSRRKTAIRSSDVGPAFALFIQWQATTVQSR